MRPDPAVRQLRSHEPRSGREQLQLCAPWELPPHGLGLEGPQHGERGHAAWLRLVGELSVCQGDLDQQPRDPQ